MSFDKRYRELVSGAWKGPVAAVLRGCLSALEPLYRWEIGRRNRRYDLNPELAFRVTAPVISVGNLTVGGVGKTPFACWLVRRLWERQVIPALLSRGYGSQRGQPNDEALELAAELPTTRHYQSPNRIAIAQEAVAAGAQVLVLDDGFQHRRLARDLDIVILDALQPFGFGRLLPRGLLREPLASLQRAHVIALSRSDAVSDEVRQEIREEVSRWAPAAEWAELVHRPAGLLGLNGDTQPLDFLRGQRIAAFAGIGNPAGFRHTLAQCGAEVVGWREFPDHFGYPEKAQCELQSWIANQSVDIAVCTRKDLVKLSNSLLRVAKPLFAISVEAICIRGEAQILQRLDAITQRARHQAANGES